MSETHPAVVPSTAELFLRFTQVGASGFGGVMPWARRMLTPWRDSRVTGHRAGGGEVPAALSARPATTVTRQS